MNARTTPDDLFPTVELEALLARAGSVLDDETLAAARRIVEDVRLRGETAVRQHAIRLGELTQEGRVTFGRAALDQAADSLSAHNRGVLERTAGRIKGFAQAQMALARPITAEIPGGRAGHVVNPVQTAGCYAPGGRFPLPSSVLMTVVPARVAGVGQVWVASPRPTTITLAAAAIAGADGLLAIGGAQAVATLAFGACSAPRCDVVCGPGNRWVTAAKYIVSREAGIDMLAGPSELVVVADDSANPGWIAADLLAQAEHDVDALPVLVSLSSELIDRVRAELSRQLSTLPTRSTAAPALARGGVIRANNLEEAASMVNRLAPEHLQLSLKNATAAVERFQHYGALFVGERSAEVFGDYGLGPNHVLPTSAGARHTAGLSVFTFLRFPTWITMDTASPTEEAADVVTLAQMEGLEGHARAAMCRG